MVFIPILIMDLEVGQLFRDIAVAISVSVMLSLLVAVTLIPALSNRLLGGVTSENKGFRVPFLDKFGSSFTRFWTDLCAICSSSEIFGSYASYVNCDCGGSDFYFDHAQTGLLAKRKSKSCVRDRPTSSRL